MTADDHWTHAHGIPDGAVGHVAAAWSGHRFTIELDRFRVVCSACPWFYYRLGATKEDLRQAGHMHTSTMRENDT